MKYLPALLLSILFQSALSQNPLPSFDASAAWSFNYGTCQGCTPNNQQYLYLDGDTLYKGKNYKIVRRYVIVQPEWTDINWSFQDCINAGQCDPNDLDPRYYKPEVSILLRESNDSIFMVGKVSHLPEDPTSIQGDEKLFYVNNLNKGDRLITEIHPSPGILVDSVGYLSIGGISRRVTYLEIDVNGGNADKHHIVEGVGMFTTGGMTGYSGFAYEVINVSGIYLGPLDCFGESAIDSLSNIENKNTFRTYSTCVRPYDIVMSSNESITAFKFNAFALKNGNLSIETSVQKLQVYNVQGKLVYQSNQTQKQFSSVFKTEGIYFLQIEKNNKLYYHKLFYKK